MDKIAQKVYGDFEQTHRSNPAAGGSVARARAAPRSPAAAVSQPMRKAAALERMSQPASPCLLLILVALSGTTQVLPSQKRPHLPTRLVLL